MDGGMRIDCGKRCAVGGDVNGLWKPAFVRRNVNGLWKAVHGRRNANRLWKPAFVQWDADGLRESELELRKNGGRCALLSGAVRAFVEKNLSGGAE